MALDKYILDDHGEPVIEPDLLKWAMWLEAAGEKRRVGLDYLTLATAAATVTVTISTVFLGLDYDLTRRGTGPAFAPILYETLVRGGRHDGYMRRYRTRDEALEGHKSIVAMIQHKETTDVR